LSTALVLVADDEPGIRDLLAWELGAFGHEVVTAADGLEALERFGEAEFDLVVSDVRMPRLGGLGLLRELKRRAPDTEVVIATGYAELQAALECVHHGAFDLVQKPFTADQMLATVARALERRQRLRAAALHERGRELLEGRDPEGTRRGIEELAVWALRAERAELLLGTISTESVLDGGRLRVPLVCDRRVLGMLGIYRGRPFGRRHLDRAAAVAQLVARAVERTQLVQGLASSERLASVGLLAAGAAHEINNPVASVLGNQSLLQEQLLDLLQVAKIIESGADSEAIRREWARIGGSELVREAQVVVDDLGAGAAQIREIAQDIRRLGRVEASEAVRFDVNDAVHSALRITAAELRGRATVTALLGSDLVVVGSPGRLSQVVVNLLVNAGQALAEASHSDGQIEVRSVLDGEHVLVTVSDNGPGIPPEHLEQIFEMFFTTRGATTGTGIGLSISRQIARAHGGELWASAGQLQGTSRGACFALRIPLAPSGLQGADVVSPRCLP
jgi:two-component system NtrC family sensor kinase